jgi:hypothetical protein
VDRRVLEELGAPSFWLGFRSKRHPPTLQGAGGSTGGLTGVRRQMFVNGA